MNGRTGELRKDGRAADVVGMEVRDDDSLDRSVEPDKRFAPAVGRVVDPEARVDDRPAVRPPQPVAMDVIDAERQRERQAYDVVVQELFTNGAST
jgi:hypothetical protein